MIEEIASTLAQNIKAQMQLKFLLTVFLNFSVSIPYYASSETKCYRCLLSAMFFLYIFFSYFWFSFTFGSESLFVFNSSSTKLQIYSSSVAGTNWSEHTTNKNKFPKEWKPHKFAWIRFEYLNKHSVLRKINLFFCRGTWNQGLNYGSAMQETFRKKM